MDGILPGVRLAARSRIYHSAPHELARLEYPWPDVFRAVGEEPLATPWYANMVVRLDCAPGITPDALFEALMRLEAELGRNRLMEPRWGARFLDVDLLLFGQERRLAPRLTLPHPRMAQRAFVVLPLLEIAPEKVSTEIIEGLSFSASDTMIF